MSHFYNVDFVLKYIYIQRLRRGYTGSSIVGTYEGMLIRRREEGR